MFQKRVALTTLTTNQTNQTSIQNCVVLMFTVNVMTMSRNESTFYHHGNDTVIQYSHTFNKKAKIDGEERNVNCQ